MSLFRYLVACFSVVVLVSCTPYCYKEYAGTCGYSDLALSGSQMEVTFVAPRQFNSTQAKKYALVRAAELAAKGNKQYVKILETRYGQITETDVREGETRFRQRGDTLGNIDIEVEESPAYAERIDRVAVTVLVSLSNDSTGNAIPAGQLLEMARREDIIND